MGEAEGVVEVHPELRLPQRHRELGFAKKPLEVQRRTQHGPTKRAREGLNLLHRREPHGLHVRRGRGDPPAERAGDSAKDALGGFDQARGDPKGIADVLREGDAVLVVDDQPVEVGEGHDPALQAPLGREGVWIRNAVAFG